MEASDITLLPPLSAEDREILNTIDLVSRMFPNLSSGVVAQLNRHKAEFQEAAQRRALERVAIDFEARAVIHQILGSVQAEEHANTARAYRLKMTQI